MVLYAAKSPLVSIQSHIPSVGLVIGTGNPNDRAAMVWAWGIRNTGQLPALAGMRLNLQGDTSLSGDLSQLIIEANGGVAGRLATPSLLLSTNAPVSILPGTQGTLVIAIEPLLWDLVQIQDEQDTLLNNFNWWIFELTMWDLDRNALIMDDAGNVARHEVRNWAKFVRG